MGPEGYLRFVLALIFVVGLIGTLAFVARRMGFGFPAQAIKNRSDRRIGVVEVTPLDARRKMVLVRRDDVEHLIVVSPTSETVIERGIQANQMFRQALEEAESAHRTEAAGETPKEPDQ